jgi:hypothetical protein
MQELSCRRCGAGLLAVAGRKVQCRSCLAVFSVKTAEDAKRILSSSSEHSRLPRGVLCIFDRVQGKRAVQW